MLSWEVALKWTFITTFHSLKGYSLMIQIMSSLSFLNFQTVMKISFHNPGLFVQSIWAIFCEGHVTHGSKMNMTHHFAHIEAKRVLLKTLLRSDLEVGRKISYMRSRFGRVRISQLAFSFTVNITRCNEFCRLSVRHAHWLSPIMQYSILGTVIKSFFQPGRFHGHRLWFA